MLGLGFDFGVQAFRSSWLRRTKVMLSLVGKARRDRQLGRTTEKKHTSLSCALITGNNNTPRRNGPEQQTTKSKAESYQNDIEKILLVYIELSLY